MNIALLYHFMGSPSCFARRPLFHSSILSIRARTNGEFHLYAVDLRVLAALLRAPLMKSLVVTPRFNLATTTSSPLGAACYLEGMFSGS